MASTAKSLATVNYGGDSYQNYDFDSKTVAANNVDWPVDLVFWGNASISKVYTKINWSWSGSTEYERVNDGSGNAWVSSGGRKNTICTDTHYRIYAPSLRISQQRDSGALRDRNIASGQERVLRFGQLWLERDRRGERRGTGGGRVG